MMLENVTGYGLGVWTEFGYSSYSSELGKKLY